MVIVWAGKLRAASNAAQAVISTGVNMAFMFVCIPALSPAAGPTRQEHRYQQIVTLSIYLIPCRAHLQNLQPFIAPPRPGPRAVPDRAPSRRAARTTPIRHPARVLRGVQRRPKLDPVFRPSTFDLPTPAFIAARRPFPRLRPSLGQSILSLENRKPIMSRSRPLVFALCALLWVGVSPLKARQAGSRPDLTVLRGPGSAPLGSIARLAVPAGYVFLDANNTRLFLKSRGEPVSGHEAGFLTITNQTWSVLFIFDQTGYVKDDEQDKLDAAKLLESIKQGVARRNNEQQRNGNPPVEVIGWELPPKYDPATHRLDWAIRGVSEGRPVVNYNTRLLGREGVMEVILVVAPERLPETLPVFRKVLAGCSYEPGQAYADYRAGDKVAKYGLGALVLSGAAVGAAKSGLLAWAAVLFNKAWVLIIVALAVVAALLSKPFWPRPRRAKK